MTDSQTDAEWAKSAPRIVIRDDTLYAALRLDQILDTMDIPDARREDYRWLVRNLGINNWEHEDFAEADRLVRQILSRER